MDINDTYNPCILNYKLNVNLSLINDNIDAMLLDTLKKTIEGKCIRDGYVKPDSVKLVNRSIGTINDNSFKGYITYNITYSADICNPSIASEIMCKVVTKNKLGILASAPPLSIIVAKQHTDKDIFKQIDVDKMIHVSIVGKTFKLNDRVVQVIAKLAGEDAIELSGGGELIIPDTQRKNSLAEDTEDLTTILNEGEGDDEDEDDDVEDDEEDLVDEEEEVDEEEVAEEDVEQEEYDSDNYKSDNGDD